MPGPHKGVLTQCNNQQVLAKPRHQPSERDQQARKRLRQKAKIKSCAYTQLGEENITNCTSNICTRYTSDTPLTGFNQHYNRYRYSSYAICYTRRHQLHAHH